MKPRPTRGKGIAGDEEKRQDIESLHFSGLLVSRKMELEGNISNDRNPKSTPQFMDRGGRKPVGKNSGL